MSMVPTTEGYSGKPQASAEVGQNAGVVFVDLDGTLIETDLLCEALVTLAKKSTGLFLRLLLRLSNGRSVFKRAVSEVIMPDIRQLPFRQDVLDFISEQRTLGRKIILATASDSIWAQRIADELGLFDGILASNGTQNLKGSVKLQAIRSYCQEQGYSEFDYLGDSHADLPIWREARGVYIVAPSKRLLGKVRKFTDPAGMLGIRKSRMSALFSALRPHQWVKNILVFVPAITSHSMLHPPVAIASTIAFACFSICASAAYILNDLADINADRRHPTKRQRPFASGTLPISWGLPMACGLLILGFLLSGLMLPASFSLALGTYFVVTCAYSFFARGVAILDVMTLAGLYTIRVLAGGRATSIAVSEWLMAFSMFLFVSLAFAKRYAELERLLRSSKEASSGRGYRVSDIGLIESMGPASGYVAVLVLALYVNGEQMKSLYRDSGPLWAICGLLMYWIGRLWMKAKRGELAEDPIVFALKDRVSLLIGTLLFALLVAASYL